MDIPEMVGQSWQGPATSFEYVALSLNKVILIHEDDFLALRKKYGNDKLTII